MMTEKIWKNFGAMMVALMVLGGGAEILITTEKIDASTAPSDEEDSDRYNSPSEVYAAIVRNFYEKSRGKDLEYYNMPAATAIVGSFLVYFSCHILELDPEQLDYENQIDLTGHSTCKKNTRIMFYRDTVVMREYARNALSKLVASGNMSRESSAEFEEVLVKDYFGGENNYSDIKKCTTEQDRKLRRKYYKTLCELNDLVIGFVEREGKIKMKPQVEEEEEEKKEEEEEEKDKDL